MTGDLCPHTVHNMMTTQHVLFPRQMDVRVFLRWQNEGEAMFSRKVPYPERKETITSLTNLIHRLGLPEQYELMRREILGKGSTHGMGARYGQAPRFELRDELYRVTRLAGYIYPDERTGGFGLVPVTPRQITIINRLAWGRTSDEVAEELHVGRCSVHARLADARAELGCDSTVQLAACVYRHRWLPDRLEHQALLRAAPRDHPTSPGYRLENSP